MGVWNNSGIAGLASNTASNFNNNDWSDFSSSDGWGDTYASGSSDTSSSFGDNFNNMLGTGLGLAKLGANLYNLYNSSQMMKAYKKQQAINNRYAMNNYNNQVQQDYYNKANAGNGLVGLMGTNATTDVANNIRNGIDNSRLYQIDSKGNKTTQPNSVFV